MNKQSPDAGSSIKSAKIDEGARGTAGEQSRKDSIVQDVADKVHEVAGMAKTAATDTASTVAGQVTDALDRKVMSGADLIGRAAAAARQMAEEVEPDAPQVASMVRSAAEMVEGYANQLHARSAADLAQSATDFARRQPALVFGIAAAAGFVALRTMKSASNRDGRHGA